MIFEFLMLFVLLCGKQLTNDDSFYDILLIGNIPFWFIIDYIFGIGQENIYTRNKKKP